MARRRIGALWLKQGKNGQFFSGVLELLGEDIPIIVFPTKKDGEAATTRPDYEILRAREDGDAKASA
jgi:hypothetical protein